jgi:hypothetical protein
VHVVVTFVLGRRVLGPTRKGIELVLLAEERGCLERRLGGIERSHRFPTSELRDVLARRRYAHARVL